MTTPDREYPEIPEEFLKPYDHLAVEDGLYKAWKDSGVFNPDVCVKEGFTAPDAPTFSMVLPPPNVTGILHAGHALMLVIQDIMVRQARMQGKRTLWLPGTDHAAISTQSMVEKQLAKDGVRRHDLGRDEFLKRVNEFALDKQGIINSQVAKMGSSVDWSREAFTLDAPREIAVRTAFKRMYEDGLIYRGHRIVNWDPKGQTTISDDEIVYAEEKSKFYYFKYGPFTIGTARPETKFGDKYVVVHPTDPRYAQYEHGQQFELEWINGPITATVIKDEAIDPEFGTGAMTITPWHSAVDFEIAERHKLDKEQIIDKYGKLLPVAGDFAGMKITDARAKIVDRLREKGLLEKEEDYTHNIATAERTGGHIEPQIMHQWFINVNKEFTMAQPANDESGITGIAPGTKTTLKQLMIAAVRNGQIDILPGDRFERVYFNWIENLRDWCISRQIWYGHRIPVWYKGDETFVGLEAPAGDGWSQDEDTLDTWFSSGLWTFSTLGWPDAVGNPTSDFHTYHPTNVIETGADILFFWVARMILMSGYLVGEVPFRTVYLHGLVRDGQGRKFSKTLGNGVDPLVLIEKYGTDSLRMALIVGNGPGNDLSLNEDKIKAYRKFSNKLWNVARFVLESYDKYDGTGTPIAEYMTTLEAMQKEVLPEMDTYRYYLASEKLYHYVWHEFADKIIEEAKAHLQDPARRANMQATLMTILKRSLVLLHPFMPFITQEIWSKLPRTADERADLIVERWPTDTTPVV